MSEVIRHNGESQFIINKLVNAHVSFSLVGVQDADLSVLSQTMAQCCKNIKETVQMLASRHKDIHGSVSKVGKAIDRVRSSSFYLGYFIIGIYIYICIYISLIVYFLV